MSQKIYIRILAVTVGLFVVIWGVSLWAAAYQHGFLQWGAEARLYFDIYKKIAFGAWPHIDFFIEYPPLAALYIGWIGWFLPNMQQNQFLFWYTAYTGLVCLVGGIWNWWFWTRGYTRNHKLAGLTTGGYFVSMTIIYPLVFTRYDVFPAIAGLIGLGAYILYVKKEQVSWLWAASLILNLGFLIKIYPILLLILVGISEISRGKWKSLGIIVTCSLLLYLTQIPFLIYGGANFDRFLEIQAGSRDIQIESIYAGIIFLVERLGWIPKTNIQLQNGAYEIYNDYAKWLAGKVFPILAVGLIGVLSMASWSLRGWRAKPGYLPKLLVGYGVLLVGAFVLFNKVFSPQYLVWMVGLLPLIGVIHHEKAINGQIAVSLSLIWLACLGLTVWIYPMNYQTLVDVELGAVIWLNLRNFGLFGLWLTLLGWLYRRLRYPVKTT